MRHRLKMQRRLDSISTNNPTLSDGLAVYDALKGVDEKILQLRSKAFANDIALLEKAKKETLSHKDLSRKHTAVGRWLDAGYDRSFITSDPEAVAFFGESDFRMVKMFKDAKSQLLDANMDLVFDKGKVLFKVENQWKSYAEIKNEIKYDPDDKKFPGWTYVHPDGFIPVDFSEWTTLPPLAQLSSTAHAALKEIASKFWTTDHAEIDPGVDKPCVLQAIVVNGNFRSHPVSLLSKNIIKKHHRHCTLRLVDPEGKVYAFGLWASRKEKDFVYGINKDEGVSSRTGTSKLCVQDFSEFIKLRHADSVSIPISKDRFLKIKEKAENINKNGGFRFCLFRRNCCRLVQDIMEMGGVKINTRLTMPQYVVSCLPDVDDIPYVGGSLGILSRAISKAQMLLPAAPKLVKQVFDGVGNVTFFMPKKALAALCSLPVLFLGGTQGSESKIKEDPASTSGADDADMHQTRIIKSFWDIFKEETSVMYHSYVLQEWIKKQGSYQFFDNLPSGFCVVKM